MKIKFKSFLALFLALAMAFSFAACGKGGDGGKTPAKPGNDKAETPEYVYNAEFKPLESISSDGYLNVMLFTDEGFYASCYEKVGENIPEGATVEYEGQYDVRESRLYFIGSDGSVRLLDGYKAMPADENPNDYAEFYSGSNLNGLALSSDGKLIAVENVYSSWYDGPADISQDSSDYWNYYQYEQKYYIRTLDADGSELSSALIPTSQDSYLNTYNMQMDENGNLLFTNDMSIRAIAPDGTDAYTIEAENYVERLIRLKDGRLGALSWGEQGMGLNMVDPETKSFGETIELPYNAYELMSGGGDYDLYYTSGINFYGYKIDTKESEKLLNWISCDVNNNDLSGVYISSDGRISGILNHWNNKDHTSTNEMVTLTKVPYDSVPHKEVLTLAVMYLDWEARNMIVDFNRNNDKCRIEIKDYSEYNTEDDYEAGLTKLTTEIMAGNMPDIISTNQLPYTQLAAKGLLEDLYPFMDADSEFGREDFFQNVLAALEVNGGLYATCPSFQISTVIGASSVVGDTPGWTYEQFNEALASMPEGCTPFDQYTTRENILQTCLFLDMDNFVDWTTGQCRFDSQDFIDLLNFAALFPEEFDWDNYEWTQEDDPKNRIAQGKQMLMQSSIYDFTDIQYNDFYFGGDATYIGFPTASGVGNSMYLGSGYAMSSSCANKEAAWEFLRIFFTEDYQQGVWGMPTNLAVYNDKLKEAMTPDYQKDAEGNFVLDENGEKIEISHGGIGFGDGTTYDIYAVTQEQADELWDVITSTTRAADTNNSVFDIVSEQAAAFFAGQKSAEEVAKLVQSKANIYVNEQR